MSWERRKREAARPANQRSVRPRRRVWRSDGGDTVGVSVEVGTAAAFLTPAAVFELADRLVDLAERLELEGAAAPDLPQASTSATDTA